MGLFKKKADPISQRSKQLKAEIEALEAQIKQLANKAEQDRHLPRVRSTAFPGAPNAPVNPPPPAPAPAVLEPIFEPLDKRNIEAEAEPPPNAAHFNELGVRKYDLPAAFKRWINHFRGPTATNPKLVSYLAAGSIKGLRPLRYEKRVARNRFIALFSLLLLLLWGIFAYISQR